MKGLTPDFEHLSSLMTKVQGTFSTQLRGRNILFLDYPLHNNVGDWLIYHGTMALLTRLGCNIKQQYCTKNYRTILTRKIPQDWIVVLHGGGNFGDIYPVHQQLRLDAIRAFPNNKIVLMPQSIHFNNPAGFEEQAKVYRAHNDITVHVRDHESYAFLEQYLDTSQICLTPDMASMLLDSWEWKNASEKTLFFRRRDCEAPESQKSVNNAFDWEELFDGGKRRIMRQIARLAVLEGKLNMSLGAAHLWRRYTHYLLESAHAAFEDYNTVDTDRLHGMIFAILLGKKVILRDNSYGKIERYTRAWFAELSYELGK